MTPAEAWATIKHAVEFHAPNLDPAVAVVAQALAGATPGDVRAALERLRHFLEECGGEGERADLALVAAHVDAGARAGEERARAIEECAQVADKWAQSKSCATDGPCEHIRMATTIAEKIRALLPPAAPERGCGPEGEPDTTTMEEIRQWRRPSPERGEEPGA